MTTRIESLLSARLFLVPQLVADRIYFISNLNGRNSLYAMDYGGNIPEPLLPPHIALQNPHHIEGLSFAVFPQLDQILVMIDHDGDERYQPMFIPIQGGYPELAFGDQFQDDSVFAVGEDLQHNIVYFIAQSNKEPIYRSYRANLATKTLEKIGESQYGGFPSGNNKAHNKFILLEQYGAGDHVLYRFDLGDKERRLLYGLPLEAREPGQRVPPMAIGSCYFVCNDSGIIFTTVLFEDTYGLGYMALDQPDDIKPITMTGIQHEGVGELELLEHLQANCYMLRYNIDGCSWLYEGAFDEATLTMNLEYVICGQGNLSNGVLESARYDKETGRYALSFSTATSPTQIYTIEGETRDHITQHTNERILGIGPEVLSPGEDASFISYDDLRISARLYLPAESLGFPGPRPLVYYIHGGPQSQERPDFAWFSMPLIQFLTLHGFAVFVPNVRGSTGYGFAYMNRVVRDWGGADRLDHVHAMTEILPQDKRLDMSRAAVVGRSYGGYMTLTLAARYPELWSAAIDMFGPYDLTTFAERVPETWKPYIAMLVGDPVTEREFLLERSPHTYIEQLACPMLVIQGKNDPRVIEQESRELVEELRHLGKDVEYLMFEDEGHDVLKFENKVRCYNAITDFFKKHLMS
jgi:pimeloyl-ACP methyl ester carboxylesterase